MKGKSKMPVLILLMGVIFNILNGLMQGEWIFYLAPSDYYTPGWLLTPCFWIGTLLFLPEWGSTGIRIQSSVICVLPEIPVITFLKEACIDM